MIPGGSPVAPRFLSLRIAAFVFALAQVKLRSAVCGRTKIFFCFDWFIERSIGRSLHAPGKSTPKIYENLRKSTKVNENQGTSMKIRENLGKSLEINENPSHPQGGAEGSNQVREAPKTPTKDLPTIRATYRTLR